MPDFDTSTFARSVAGQLLRRLGEQSADALSLAQLGLGPRDMSALSDLERMGYVVLTRGAGALAWKVERVAMTAEGRTRYEKMLTE